MVANTPIPTGPTGRYGKKTVHITTEEAWRHGPALGSPSKANVSLLTALTCEMVGGTVMGRGGSVHLNAIAFGTVLTYIIVRPVRLCFLLGCVPVLVSHV